MTDERIRERLRVDVPTLEPDPAFLGMLAHRSAAAPTAAPRSTRSAGLRLALATGSVAVIATATWAAGVPTGGGVPHSPADRPSPSGPAGTPSPGDVGTPHSDVATPGSPLSPGLPGDSSSSPSGRATDPEGADRDRGTGGRPGDRGHRGKDHAGGGDKKGPKKPEGGKPGKPGKAGKPAGQSGGQSGGQSTPPASGVPGPPAPGLSAPKPQDPLPEDLDAIAPELLPESAKDDDKADRD